MKLYDVLYNHNILNWIHYWR